MSKDIYKIKVVRKSSGCSLEALTIKGGTVKDLEQSLNSGVNSFILELDSDDGEITFDDIQISADATYTIDGTEVEDNTYTVNAGAVSYTHLDVYKRQPVWEPASRWRAIQPLLTGYTN